MNPRVLKIFRRHLLIEKSGYKSYNLNNSCEIKLGDGTKFYCKLLTKPTLNICEEEIYGMGGSYTPRAYKWNNLEFVLCSHIKESTEVFYNMLSEYTEVTSGRRASCANYKKYLELNCFNKEGFFYESWQLNGSQILSCEFNNNVHRNRNEDYIRYNSEVKCTISFDRAILKF